MDIRQLRYFITIVDSDCNLSLAARKIHITQSALSQFVTNYENTENILLFERHNGRLVKLTPSGEKLYKHAQKLIQAYNQMTTMIQQEATKQKGTLRIGIASNLTQFYFADFLPNFITKHPEYNVVLIEDGAKKLKEKLINGTLDYAVLIEPTHLDRNEFEEYFMRLENFKAFVREGHPLAEKKSLTWADLISYPISTFNKRFTTHELLQAVLEKEAPQARIIHTSFSWEYLLQISQHSDAVTILPALKSTFTKLDNLVMLPLQQPFQLVILLCRPRRDHYQEPEHVLHHAMLDYFYRPAPSNL